MHRTSSPLFRRACAALALTAPLALGGCGGKGGDVSASANAPISLPGDDAVTASTTEGRVGKGSSGADPSGTLQIDKTIHYAGFTVKAVSGEIRTSPRQFAVDLEVTNDGEATDQFAPQNVTLEKSGVEAIRGEVADPKNVGAGNRTTTTITFAGLPALFDPTTADLVFGSGQVQQARIPLSGKGPVLTREPFPQAARPVLTAGTLVVTVTDAKVRYDNPDRHRQAEKGKAILALDVSITFGGPMADVNVFNSSLVLVRPTGQTDIPKNDVNLLMQPKETEELTLYYEIPTPVAGGYKLTSSGRYYGADLKDARGEIGFSLTNDPNAAAPS